MDEIRTFHETVNPHSVTIGRSAAGAVTLEVKVYASSPEDAARTAALIFCKLEEAYPAMSKSKQP